MIASPALAQFKTLKLHEEFSGQAALSDAWQVADWRNGPPFGCAFTPQQVSRESGFLTLAFDAGKDQCSEVRTLQSWQYGAFITEMQPASVPGTVSSFFLYAGSANVEDHYEIDIEFVGEQTAMHTNVWVKGKPDEKRIELRAFGINPQAGPRHVGFVWTPHMISFHVRDDGGQWLEVRRVRTAIAAPMQLMMNAWYGDNKGSALVFPGKYGGRTGQVRYRSVSVWQ